MEQRLHPRKVSHELLLLVPSQRTHDFQPNFDVSSLTSFKISRKIVKLVSSVSRRGPEQDPAPSRHWWEAR